ncbi:DUF3549 family protein [Thaumasiovibrio sp. DFM-14]|uniref:DUF3549 family protein n=1 Tax=Thaumasiovibrio sp. DFM-14 TaxID=3384792 RepID=UPI00399F9BD5
MTAIHHLSQLLTQAGCTFQIFDLGRRVSPIATDIFQSIEKNQQPYPYPLQHHAQFALAFRQPTETEPFIWLLKFPLDERGLLKSAAVGDFIRYVAEAMGQQLTAPLSDERQKQLAANPYLFKPSEDKLAMLHAFLRLEQHLPPSHYYAQARHYLSLQGDKQTWQQLGLQGFADIAVRLDNDNNATLVKEALAQLPPPPLFALLGCLEHVALPTNIITSLGEMLEEGLNTAQPDHARITALVRALAGARPDTLSHYLHLVLAHPLLNTADMLIAIAGRCWQGLNEARVQQYLLRLAENGDQALFNALFADLVAIPTLRCHLLPLLHQPLPGTLQHALQNMQSTLH